MALAGARCFQGRAADEQQPKARSVRYFSTLRLLGGAPDVAIARYRSFSVERAGGNLLARANAPAIARLASGEVLIGIDYDGTAAPSGRDTRENRMRPRTAALLREANALGIPIVAITGRQWSQAVDRLAGTGIPGDRIAGNHGAEVAGKILVPQAQLAVVRRAVDRAREALEGVPGVVVNDKVASFSIYDTGSSNPKLTRSRIERAIASISGMGVHRSQFVFDLYPLGGPRHDKGTALESFMRRLNLRESAFIGDADNDAPAFKAVNKGGGISIGVGDRRPPSARFHLTRQEDLDDFLHRLVDTRKALRPGRG